MSFICHIHNYTEYNQQWNVFSAFNPSKCTHTWSSGQPTLQHPRSSRGFGALLKGLTSVMDNSSRSQDSNPQPRVTSLTLYPLGHDCPTLLGTWVGHPFPFRTALILRGIDLTRCWKHSSEIFCPYWHDRIKQLLQICRLHIPKMLYWIEIWWLWRPFE